MIDCLQLIRNLVDDGGDLLEQGLFGGGNGEAVLHWADCVLLRYAGLG